MALNQGNSSIKLLYAYIVNCDTIAYTETIKLNMNLR